MEDKRLRVGWFAFTCCEDSSILFTELLNEHFFEWRKAIDFRYMRILKSHNDPSNLDVAFIEGAVSSEKEAAEIKEIRNNSKKVIAVGSCACTGKPSDNRNSFSPDVLDKYKDVFETFQYSDKVRKIEDVIEVDDKVPGCPMNAKMFVEKLNLLIEEFKSQNAQII